MSFILDALKKSENERQGQAEAEFATVPSASDAPSAPRWLWVLAALLAINALVLLGFMLKPSPPPADRAASALAAPPVNSATSRPAPVANSGTNTFRAQVDEARRNRPAEPVASAVTVADTAVAAPPPEAQRAVSVDNLLVSRSAQYPTLSEVRANGTVSLPDLHLDLHRYTDNPGDRFVFINMDKHQENSQLAAGPVVREITRDGVLLEYQGTTFLLTRD